MEGHATVTIASLVAKGAAEVKTGPFGTQLHASDYVANGTPVINVRNIGYGSIREAELEYIDAATVSRLSSHVLETGDIVFGRKGAVDRHAFLREEHSRWFQGSDCIRLRFVGDEVNPRFVSYCLLTPKHREWMLQQCSHGATMASLNQEIVGRIALPAVPRRTQDRIAGILSGYDDLIENNSKQIKVLEEITRSLYCEWFVRFRFPGHEKVGLVTSPLGRVPKGWRVDKLAAALVVHRGRSYKGTELAERGGVPFINLKCFLRDGGFRRDGLKRFTGLAKPQQFVRMGDLVVAVTDMTQERRIIARIARVPRLTEPEAVISMDVVKLEPRIASEKEFLYAMLRYSSFSDELKKHANGANVLHLSPERIETFVTCQPPTELAARFGEVCRPLLEHADVLSLKSENLAATRDLLIPRLISRGPMLP